MKPNIENKAIVRDVAVASGATDSDAIDLEGFPLIGFIFPTITSTAMSFKVAKDLYGSYVALNDEAGSLVSITVASSKGVSLTPTLLARLGSFRYIKLVLGSAEGGARVIGVSLKG